MSQECHSSIIGHVGNQNMPMQGNSKAIGHSRGVAYTRIFIQWTDSPEGIGLQMENIHTVV